MFTTHVRFCAPMIYCVLMVAILLTTPHAAAQCQTHMDRIVGGSGSNQPIPADTEGDIAAIYADSINNADHDGDSGVIVYQRQSDTWMREAIILADNVTDISISNGRIAFLDSGAVRLFEETMQGEWTAQSVVLDMPGEVPYGYSLELQEDMLFIGDFPTHVSVFEKQPDDSWLLLQTLTPFDKQPIFSAAIEVHGDTLAVFDAVDSVYTFEYRMNQWAPEQRISLASIAGVSANQIRTVLQNLPGGLTTQSLALHNNRLIIAGSDGAEIYERNSTGWHLRALLPDAFSQGSISRSVAIQNNTALVGAPNGGVSCELVDHECGSGEVRQYERSTTGVWQVAHRILPDEPRQTFHFGQGLALDGDDAIVICPEDMTNQLDASIRVYFLNGFNEADCDENGVADTCQIADCEDVDQNSDGIPDVCDDDFVVFFTGQAGDDWFDPANWSQVGVPDSEAHVVISRAVAINRAGAQAHSITIACGGALTLDLADLTCETLAVERGGELRGEGIVTTPDLYNDGTLAPGDAVGTLEIHGNFTQSPAGELHIDLAGPGRGLGFDALDVTGTVNLGGVIRINIPDVFTPSAGFAYEILTFANRVGAFDRVATTTLDYGLAVECEYGFDHMKVVLEAPGTPIGVCETLFATTPGKTAVAIRGDLAVLGDRVFERRDEVWVETQTLTAQEQPLPNILTSAAAIGSDFIALGSISLEEDGYPMLPIVYVFMRDDDTQRWELETTLTNTLQANVDFDFGIDLAADDTALLVGAPVDVHVEDADSSLSQIRIYDRDEMGRWTPQQTISYPGALANFRFGATFEIDGDTMVVGGYMRHDFGSGSHPTEAAYVFNKDSHGQWQFVATIPAPDQDPSFQVLFGWDVAIDGDLIAVWEVSNENFPLFEQQIYVYRVSGEEWRPDHRLTLPFEGNNVYFGGDHVLLERDTLIASAFSLSFEGATGSGAAYIYHHDGHTWRHNPQPIIHPDGESNFGLFGDIDNGTLVLASDSGLHIYEGVTSADCNGNTIADACDILAGNSTDKDDDGVPDDCLLSCTADCAPTNPDGTTGNGVVNIDDLLTLNVAMVTQDLNCDIAPENADGTIGNGVVDINDLLAVIENFGPCEE